MPVTLTPAQLAAVDLPSTRPVMLVRLDHSGTQELLSCSGNIEFDGELYTAGGVSIDSVSDGSAASLSLPATPERVAEVQNGTWRHAVCKIYAVPAVPGDSGSYVTADAILMLDGVIMASSFSGGKVSVSAIQRSLDGSNTPRNTISEVASHIPPPGSILTWTTSITLVARR